MTSRYITTAALLLSLFGTHSPSLADNAAPTEFTFPDSAIRGDIQYVPGTNHRAYVIGDGIAPKSHSAELDQGAFTFPAPAIAKAFTVEMWIRPLGQGTLFGNSGINNGMLIAAGNGYWDGFRIIVNNPDGELSFEIGRPQPSSSVGIRGGLLANEQWQHVAATWDGKTQRLYVNGTLTASGPYIGDFTAPTTGTVKVGFADSGVGSELFDVSSVRIVPVAETPALLFARSAMIQTLPAGLEAQINAAIDAQQAGDLKTETGLWKQIAADPGIADNLRDMASLRLSGAYTEAHQYPEATMLLTNVVKNAKAKELNRQLAASQLIALMQRGEAAGLSPVDMSSITQLSGLSPEQKSFAFGEYARILAGDHQTVAAIKQYENATAVSGIDNTQKYDIDLKIVALMASQGSRKDAMSFAKAALGSPAVPRRYYAIAMLSLANAASASGNSVVAQQIAKSVAADRAAPQTFRDEARDLVRSLDPAVALARAELATRQDSFQSPVQLEGNMIYVAPGGSDQNPGTIARPFQHIARAIAEVSKTRKLRNEIEMINLRGGTYPITQSIKIGDVKSNGFDVSITVMAYPGEDPVLSGAANISGFTAVTDSAVLARLDPAVRGKVLQADLRANGVTDFGALAEHGYGHAPALNTELFFNGKPMTLARWPNTGFVETGSVSDIGSVSPARGMVFGYAGDRPSRWLQDNDIWLYGYWYWDWADSTARVTAIDPLKHTLQTERGTEFGIRQGQRYYASNILEELDSPGEWYIDRSKGILYFYPTSSLSGATVELSVLNGPVFDIANCREVSLENLTIQGGLGSGVQLTNCSSSDVTGCTIRRMGGDAIIVAGGHDDTILSDNLYTLGRGGVRISGGDRKTLKPGHQVVENCDIYDFSRIDRTYTPAVLMEGCGNVIAHNAMHDAPHHAIRIEGNDQLVEFNEVYRVVNEADDQGGLDIWGDPSYRGNVFRYNYWHDIGSGMNAVGQAGIRLDDAISGVLIRGNIFQRCSGGNFGGVQINGGKENVIDNNLFVDCHKAVTMQQWGADRWRSYITKDIANKLHADVNIDAPPYSTKYPNLAHLLDYPGVNYVWRNTAIRCGQFMGGDSNGEVLAGNVFGGKSVDQWLEKTGKLPENAVIPAHDGCEAIPIGQMGLYHNRREINSHYDLLGGR